MAAREQTEMLRYSDIEEAIRLALLASMNDPDCAGA
jgi:hypothetical protein